VRLNALIWTPTRVECRNGFEEAGSRDFSKNRGLRQNGLIEEQRAPAIARALDVVCASLLRETLYMGDGNAIPIEI
jgi:hypothetical protein